jgi:hypothetical protein
MGPTVPSRTLSQTFSRKPSWTRQNTGNAGRGGAERLSRGLQGARKGKQLRHWGRGYCGAGMEQIPGTINSQTPVHNPSPLPQPSNTRGQGSFAHKTGIFAVLLQVPSTQHFL